MLFIGLFVISSLAFYADFTRDYYEQEERLPYVFVMYASLLMVVFIAGLRSVQASIALRRLMSTTSPNSLERAVKLTIDALRTFFVWLAIAMVWIGFQIFLPAFLA